MKLYISWSQTLGHFVAKELVYALSRVFHESVRPYFSALSISRGIDWFSANQQELSSAEYAVILVSTRGMSSPWLMYEAGALLNQASAKCEVLLLDLGVQELAGNPLSHFQCTDCRSSQFHDIFSRIGSLISTSQADAMYESVAEVVASTRVKILLMSRAEQSISEYQKSTTTARRKTRDPYLYAACAALVEAGLTEIDIREWLQTERIPPAAYANHLYNLRPPLRDGA